jgi:hypothetical protein
VWSDTNVTDEGANKGGTGDPTGPEGTVGGVVVGAGMVVDMTVVDGMKETPVSVVSGATAVTLIDGDDVTCTITNTTSAAAAATPNHTIRRPAVGEEVEAMGVRSA